MPKQRRGSKAYELQVSTRYVRTGVFGLMNAPVKRACTPQPVGRLALLGFLLLQSIACFGAMPAWEFDANNDRLGWGIPAGLTGAVIGGSLWLTPSPPLERSPAQLASLLYQAGGEWLLGTGIFATGEGPDTRKNHGPAIVQPLLANIVSPGGLNIRSPAQSDRQLQVRLRVLNLSMATDFQLKWRSASTAPDGWISRRCGLKPDLKQWQDITCFVDRSWTDTLDQIALGISANLVRGDIWIDSIRIEAGPVEPVPMRPDMVSERVIPRISVPGLSQAHFADAFKVLDETLVVQVPAYGFNYPYHKASGDDRFTDCWWQTDTSINAHAAAWVNQAFAENVARGFGEVQSYGPDGRLPIFPLDPMSGQPGDLSMNPLAFVQFAYGTATRTRDPVLRAQIYRTLKGFLDWFLSSAKRDRATGLVTGTFEEATDPPSSQEETGFSYVQTRAPVSLNVAVAVGAFLLADLAENLDQAADAARYRRVFQDLKNALNTLLWDGKEGRYYDYDLGKKQMLRYRGAGTFLTLFLKIASADRRERCDPATCSQGAVRKRPDTRKSDFANGWRHEVVRPCSSVVDGYGHHRDPNRRQAA